MAVCVPADRRLLGGDRFRGPTPWVIAIMSFSIMIIAATGLALANTAGSLSEAIATRYALEVPNGGQNLDALVAALRSAPGVTAVEAVPESEMRGTLERWLGPAAKSADLPVPALVNFDTRPGADLRAIEQRVHAIAPAAQIAAHRDKVSPLLRSMREIQWLAFGLVLLLSAAATAAVVLAARGALDTHRFTIEVMHGIGATDEQVTQLFQRKDRHRCAGRKPRRRSGRSNRAAPSRQRRLLRRRHHGRRDARASPTSSSCFCCRSR